MARKETITNQMIIDTAFEMVRNEGIESITARRVAAAVGCSTQPLFRLYKSMEELQRAVYDRCVIYFSDYLEGRAKKSVTPFADLGLAYISFARENKNYFKLLFIDGIEGGNNSYEIVNGTKGYVVEEINRARALGIKDPGEVYMRMWIFIHGCACMTVSGDNDFSDDETIKLLERSFIGFART